MTAARERFVTASRIAGGTVAWTLSFTYVVHVVGPLADTCPQGDDGPYLASLVLGPLTLLVSAAGIWLALPMRRVLRWLTAPHLLLAVATGALLTRTFLEVTVGGAYICAGNALGDGWDDMPTSWWHRAYAPLYLAALVAFLASAFRFWRWRPDAPAVS